MCRKTGDTEIIQTGKQYEKNINMKGKIQHFIVTDWCIILHERLNQEFMLREHTFKRILLRVYEYGKGEQDKRIIHLEE